MINIISGMQFAVNSLNINYSNVFAAFSFRNQINNNFIYSDPWAINATNGILSSYYDQKQMLTGRPNSLYGISTAINSDGSVLIMGGNNDNTAGAEAGGVMIYTGNPLNNNWSFKQRLTGDSTGDFFGYTVATSDNGNIIVVGAFGDSNLRGAAFIYTGNKNNGWVLKNKFTGPLVNSQFGHVTTNSDGSIIAIGGYRTVQAGQQGRGSVRIYTGNANNGWIFNASLFGDSANDFFGQTVDISKDGSTLIVGANGDDDGGADAGAAFIYTTGNLENGEWIFKQKLTGDDPLSNYGFSVATNYDGTILMLGSPDQDFFGNNAGAVLIYTGDKINPWKLKQKISGSNFNNIDINDNGSIIGIGKINKGNPQSPTGVVNIYTGNKINGWNFSQELVSNTNSNNIYDSFGRSIAINNNGNFILVGAQFTDSAFIYSKDSFNNYSGSGYFDGSTFFKLNKDFEFNNSTILISYERLTNTDEILLSSVGGNNFNNYSGFYLGVNNANKLYLKYWNNVEGIFTFTYNKTLSNKNIFTINKTSSTITIGFYNNNNFQFEFEQFPIYRNNFINSNDLYIGGSPNKINWGNDKLSNFHGYIDRLYIFNNIPFTYANRLCQGLFTEPSGFEGENQEFCYSTGFFSGSGYLYSGVTGILTSGFQSGVVSITGYQNILSGYSYTGVTGYRNVFVGSYIDNCGQNINIFDRISLSGLIFAQIPVRIALTGIVYNTGYIDISLTGFSSGTENIFITGRVCNQFFNITGDIKYYYDIDYLSSLSYPEISLLSEINTENDIVEIFSEKYNNKTLEYNKDLVYDNLNSNYFYVDRKFEKNDMLLFGNGQALIDDGYQLIPSGYEFVRSPNLDYFLTGLTIETNKFFAIEDNLFYDYFTGRFWGFKNTGNIVNVPNDINSNYWIFKNGQKLIKNKDYNEINNTQINLININANQENYIILKEFPNNFDYSSGNFGSLKVTGRFNHKCSQVYFNGIKQKINNNYVENSNFDLLSGSFNEPNEDFVFIYNNTNDFFV